jgi:hypothetical protein
MGDEDGREGASVLVIAHQTSSTPNRQCQTLSRESVISPGTGNQQQQIPSFEKNSRSDGKAFRGACQMQDFNAESVEQRSPGLPTLVGNPGSCTVDRRNPERIVQIVPRVFTSLGNRRHRNRAAKSIFKKNSGDF